jgi:hypothetical protein
MKPKEQGQKTLKKYFYEILHNGFNERSLYDYLVLFSGGKDSFYLVHLLKKARGKKICLFTIDNGFEQKDHLNKVKKSAAILGCDLYIHQPPPEKFMSYYKYLISEPKLLQIDSNPLCFFCGRQFMAMGIKFAEHYNIPFVFYGATPEQINQGFIARSIRDLKIFDMVSKKSFKTAHETIKKTKGYKENSVIREMMELVFHESKTSRLFFPFQFFDYHVDKIKMELERVYNWNNPIDGLSNKKYLSSGCSLIQLFGILQNKMNFKTKELDQFQKDFKNGILNKETYEYNKSLFEEIMKGKMRPEIKKLAEKIGVTNLLFD